MMENIRRKINQFMQGRYGVDDLNRVLMYLSLVLIVLTLFIHHRALSVITAISLVLLYFRMLSRNITARYRENQLFLNKTEGIRNWIARDLLHCGHQCS